MFSFLEFKVRLIDKYENHTGMIGPHEFEQGVSKNKLHRNQAEQLASIGFRCVAIDDDGKDVLKIEVGKIPFPKSAFEELHAKSMTLGEGKDQGNVESTQEAKTEAEPESKANYTRSQLEAIADKEGLRGLRDIADTMDIKGKSIAELIEKILKG